MRRMYRCFLMATSCVLLGILPFQATASSLRHEDEESRLRYHVVEQHRRELNSTVILGSSKSKSAGVHGGSEASNTGGLSKSQTEKDTSMKTGKGKGGLMKETVVSGKGKGKLTSNKEGSLSGKGKGQSKAKKSGESKSKSKKSGLSKSKKSEKEQQPSAISTTAPTPTVFILPPSVPTVATPVFAMPVPTIPIAPPSSPPVTIGPQPSTPVTVAPQPSPPGTIAPISSPPIAVTVPPAMTNFEMRTTIVTLRLDVVEEDLLEGFQLAVFEAVCSNVISFTVPGTSDATCLVLQQQSLRNRRLAQLRVEHQRELAAIISAACPLLVTILVTGSVESSISEDDWSALVPDSIEANSDVFVQNLQVESLFSMLETISIALPISILPTPPPATPTPTFSPNELSTSPPVLQPTSTTLAPISPTMPSTTTPVAVASPTSPPNDVVSTSPPVPPPTSTTTPPIAVAPPTSPPNNVVSTSPPVPPPTTTTTPPTFVNMNTVMRTAMLTLRLENVEQDVLEGIELNLFEAVCSNFVSLVVPGTRDATCLVIEQQSLRSRRLLHHDEKRELAAVISAACPLLVTILVSATVEEFAGDDWAALVPNSIQQTASAFVQNLQFSSFFSFLETITVVDDSITEPGPVSAPTPLPVSSPVSIIGTIETTGKISVAGLTSILDDSAEVELFELACAVFLNDNNNAGFTDFTCNIFSQAFVGGNLDLFTDVTAVLPEQLLQGSPITTLLTESFTVLLEGLINDAFANSPDVFLSVLQQASPSSAFDAVTGVTNGFDTISRTSPPPTSLAPATAPTSAPMEEIASTEIEASGMISIPGMTSIIDDVELFESVCATFLTVFADGGFTDFSCSVFAQTLIDDLEVFVNVTATLPAGLQSFSIPQSTPAFVVVLEGLIDSAFTENSDAFLGQLQAASTESRLFDAASTVTTVFRTLGREVESRSAPIPAESTSLTTTPAAASVAGAIVPLDELPSPTLAAATTTGP